MERLDARGLMCPLPVLKTAKVLRALTVDDVLTVWADDPIAVIDIPHFCDEVGHTLVSQHTDGEHQVYVIKRGPLDT